MPIKVYRSTQLGAPTMNGVVGSKITALDAILVNGYGSVSVSSITRASVTATVTTASAHGLATFDIAHIAGAVETAYNGEFEITVLTATTFTYTVTGSPSTPATGTITSKRAGAGFAKTFSGTNKAVYRANDVGSRRHYLRVLDDGTSAGGAREVRFTAYETMTDVDTGAGPCPTPAQHGGFFHAAASDTLDASGRHWLVISDGKTVLGFFYGNTTTATGDLTLPGTLQGSFGFGDAIEYRGGDIYFSFLTGNPGANLLGATSYSGLFAAMIMITNNAPTTTQATLLCMRDWTAVPGARAANAYGSGLNNGNIGANTNLPYPHAIDNGFYMTPILITQGSPSVIRGRLPGCFEPLSGPCFPNTHLIENVAGYAGRRFMMVYGRNGNTQGALVIDITGPWGS